MKSYPTTTIQDIARQAGVSKATVSLVMNGSPKISSKTCEKVLAVVQDLHYQPNEEARKLARRRWPDSIPSTFKLLPANQALPTV
jgi:DNA-binding LacI/PurR family transcriptional regulator